MNTVACTRSHGSGEVSVKHRKRWEIEKEIDGLERPILLTHSLLSRRKSSFSPKTTLIKKQKTNSLVLLLSNKILN